MPHSEMTEKFTAQAAQGSGQLLISMVWVYREVDAYLGSPTL